jgi:nucleoside-diphosphate-sugar epimerase
MKIAVLGASGFVGSRVVEMLALSEEREQVRPVVRSFGGLARLARFALDWRMADATDETALVRALEGCDAVVHSVMGTFATIERSIAPSYRAACRAGVKRMVYLSTASVHGQAPPVGTDERSPLSDRQATEYNNCKVRAERLLLAERKRGDTEAVILRPGIVFGPRDRWVTGIARDLRSGTDFLVNGGLGICNTIYVDNLVHAIRLALVATATGADREAFLVGDSESVTWADLHRMVAEELGIRNSEELILDVPAPRFLVTARDRFNGLHGHPVTQALLPKLPRSLKRSARAILNAWPEPRVPSPWAPTVGPAPVVTREMAELHQCPVKLPGEKARRLLGYEAPVSVADGVRRSVAWLRWAGLVT